MTNFNDTMLQIEVAIRAAGIALSWMRNTNSTAAGLELYFEPSVTSKQQAQARAIAESVIAEAEKV